MREHLSTVHFQQFAFVYKRQKVISFAESSTSRKYSDIQIGDLYEKDENSKIKVKLWKASNSNEPLLIESESVPNEDPPTSSADDSGLKILEAYSLAESG